jgi:hypothetical protein
VGEMISVSANQLCHYNTKAVTDNVKANENGSVPKILYLWTPNFELNLPLSYYNIIFF